MVIAFDRIGRFKLYIKSCIINFFKFVGRKIVEILTGRKSHYDEEILEGAEEKDYQGENGGLDVKINQELTI